MSDVASAEAVVTLPHFESAAALMEEHNKLLVREAALREAHNGRLDAKRDEVFIAAVMAFIRSGQATGGWLETDSERTACQSVLNYWKATLYDAEIDAPNATLAKFDSELSPKLDEKDCPYVGMDAFQEGDYNRFFGREKDIKDMVEWLRENRFLAVVGPSGSGKSSVVLAGLLPILKSGALPGSAGWRYLPALFPGSDPLRTLASTLKPEKESNGEWIEKQVSSMRNDPATLARLLGESPVSPAVLVIDQFEEIFTLVEDERQKEREAFAANLWHSIQAPGPRHTVILTVRRDKKGQILKLPAPFPDLFQKSKFEIEELNENDLRRAITEPANRVGLRFQEGIVEALVKEILGEPSGLPLLQFALLKLWEKRDRNRVTWTAYRALGGARKALGNSADEFYQNLLPAQQIVAKKVILRLVRPTVEGDRNRVLRDSLLRLGNRDVVEEVLEKLRDAYLVRETKEEPVQIEVAHEALIRSWKTLEDWIQDEQAAMRQRDSLTRLFEIWKKQGQKPVDLLRGSQLVVAEDFAEKHPDDLEKEEKEFIHRSRIQVEDEETARKKAQDDLIRQKERADYWKNVAMFSLGMIAIAILVVLALHWHRSSMVANRKATEETKKDLESQASELALRARELVRTDACLPCALAAVRALEEADPEVKKSPDLGTPTPEAVEAREEVEVAVNLVGQDGVPLATPINIEAPLSPEMQKEFCWGEDDYGRTLVFDSGRQLVVYEATNLRPPAILKEGTNTVPPAPANGEPNPRQQLAPKIPNGQEDQAAARTYTMSSAFLHPLPASLPPPPLPDCGSSKLKLACHLPWPNVAGASLSLYGDYAVTWDVSGNLTVWSTSNKKDQDDKAIRIFRSLAAPGLITAANPSAGTLTAFVDQEGKWVFAARNDGTIFKWDLSFRKPLPKSLPSWKLLASAGWVPAIRFSPDGARLAAIINNGPEERSLHLWDTKDGKEIPLPTANSQSLIPDVLEFSPDGNLLAAVDRNGVHLWNMSSKSDLPSIQDPALVWLSTRITFSPDSQLLAAADEKEARVWDLQHISSEPAKRVAICYGNSSEISVIDFSHDNTKLITISRFGLVHIHEFRLPWERQCSLVEQALHTANIRGLSLDPDKWEQWAQYCRRSAR